MNSRIEREIKNLKDDLVNIAVLCEASLKLATDSVINLQNDNFDKINEIENDIDKLEKQIENKCIHLLLQQDIFASDFRFISASLKMVSDFERIGDHAQDISKMVECLVDKKHKNNEKIQVMFEETIKMLKMSIDSVINLDIALATDVIENDDKIDMLFDEIKYDIIKLLSTNSEDAEIALDLFMVAKYLERIGDHSTNIAEWIIYYTTGVYKGINYENID